MDARQTARRSLDPETDDLFPWQKSPNRYDVQGVDSRTGTVLVNRWRCSILKDGKRVLTATSHFIKKDAQRIVDQTNKHYPEMEATLVCDAGPLKNWYPESTSPEKDKPTKKEVVPDKQVEPEGFRADPSLIDRELAMRAHSGTSFSPEKRGQWIIKEFGDHTSRIREDLMKCADTEEERDFIDAEMHTLQSGYASKMNDQLASQGRCVSTMIAGPSGFNTSRAEKANRAYDNKVDATNAYLDRAISSIHRRLNKMQVEAAGGEAEVMKDNLRMAEESQELMKAVNKILRSKKLSDEDKAQQVHTDLGLSEQLVHELMHPDWGKPGFASYQLSNNNANIRRMRERVAELQKKEDTPTTERKFDGGTLIDNCEDDRIQIDFDEKPDEAMRAKLKGSGWRWAPSIKVWQRKRTNAAIYSAKQIIGVS